MTKTPMSAIAQASLGQTARGAAAQDAEFKRLWNRTPQFRPLVEKQVLENFMHVRMVITRKMTTPAHPEILVQGMRHVEIDELLEAQERDLSPTPCGVINPVVQASLKTWPEQQYDGPWLTLGGYGFGIEANAIIVTTPTGEQFCGTLHPHKLEVAMAEINRQRVKIQNSWKKLLRTLGKDEIKWFDRMVSTLGSLTWNQSELGSWIQYDWQGDSASLRATRLQATNREDKSHIAREIADAMDKYETFARFVLVEISSVWFQNLLRRICLRAGVHDDNVKIGRGGSSTMFDSQKARFPSGHVIITEYCWPQLEHTKPHQVRKLLSNGTVKTAALNKLYMRGLGKGTQAALAQVRLDERVDVAQILRNNVSAHGRNLVDQFAREVLRKLNEDEIGHGRDFISTLEVGPMDLSVAISLGDISNATRGSLVTLRDLRSTLTDMLDAVDLSPYSPERFKLPRGEGAVRLLSNFEEEITNMRVRQQDLVEEAYREICSAMGISAEEGAGQFIPLQVVPAHWQCVIKDQDKQVKTTYAVIVAALASDLRNETKALHHCVQGSHYVQAAARGEISLVLFRTHTPQGWKPRFTVEVNMQRRMIVQARGKQNRNLSEHEEAALHAWCNHTGISMIESIHGKKSSGKQMIVTLEMPEEAEFASQEARIAASNSSELQQKRALAMRLATEKVEKLNNMPQEEKRRAHGNVLMQIRKTIDEITVIGNAAVRAGMTHLKTPVDISHMSFIGRHPARNEHTPVHQSDAKKLTTGSATLYDTRYGASLRAITFQSSIKLSRGIFHNTTGITACRIHAGNVRQTTQNPLGNHHDRRKKHMMINCERLMESTDPLLRHLLSKVSGLSPQHFTTNGSCVISSLQTIQGVYLRPARLPRSKKARQELMERWEQYKAAHGLEVNEKGMLTRGGQTLHVKLEGEINEENIEPFPLHLAVCRTLHAKQRAELDEALKHEFYEKAYVQTMSLNDERLETLQDLLRNVAGELEKNKAEINLGNQARLAIQGENVEILNDQDRVLI